MQTAVERWQEMLDARAAQMDAAYAQLGRTSADFWDRRARNFHRNTKESVARDPLFLHVQHEVTSQTSVLDVGAGTGRFALALAPQAQHVTAVEPNVAMLDYLRRDAHEQGLSNISYIQALWQDAPADLSADIVICSHVLYPIRDIVPFLAKLRAATRQTCYIYMRATPMDAASNHLWKHFHGDDRSLQPGYIHALDVMYDLGIYADVEVVKLASFFTFDSLEQAEEEMVEQLILPDDEYTRRELRELLSVWLVERDGKLRPPIQEMTAAVMWFPG
jgi:SAM-dependent methyltransferase